MAAYLISTLIGLSLLAYPTVAGYGAPNPSQALPEGMVQIAEAKEKAAGPETYEVWVTAYSSTPEETDNTPFTTAMNTEVRDGVIAANFLPFGTKLQIPALFGDRVFTVEDRLHRRKTNFVDIWMPTKESAEKFGITRAFIEVLL